MYEDIPDILYLTYQFSKPTNLGMLSFWVTHEITRDDFLKYIVNSTPPGYPETIEFIKTQNGDMDGNYEYISVSISP